MEVKNETENKDNGGVGIAWFGAIIMWIGRFFGDWVLVMIVMIGLAITVVGCILWAQRKNRHWAFGLWGILAPVGFLGVCLLKDKTPK